MTDKALEAAARVIARDLGGDNYDADDWGVFASTAENAISAYLSALPGEAEVVAWIRSDDLQEPPERRHVTAWEKVATSWAEGFHPCTPLVTLASLQAMQARAEQAEMELSDWKNGHANSVRAHAKALSRAEAAEARVKEMEEALAPAQLHVEQLSELLKIIREHWIDYDHVFSIAVHEADDWVKSRTALKGCSNG